MASVRNLSQNLSLQFNEKVWNQVKISLEDDDEEENCYLPLCIGYETTMTSRIGVGE